MKITTSLYSKEEEIDRLKEKSSMVYSTIMRLTYGGMSFSALYSCLSQLSISGQTGDLNTTTNHWDSTWEVHSGPY